MKDTLLYSDIDVKISTYYCLNGEYIPFAENPLSNKRYENVNVAIITKKENICGTEYEHQVIYVSGEKPIECELMNCIVHEETLYIKLCQDWG